MADEDIKEKINNLTNSDLIQNDRLEEAEERLDQLDRLLEGDPTDRDDNGLKGIVGEQARRLNRLEALMAPDAIGEGGIINRLKRLEKQAGIKEREVDNHWKAWIAFISLLGVVTAAVISNLDRIEKFMEPKSSIQAPRPRKKVVRVRRVPAPPPVEEPQQ